VISGSYSPGWHQKQNALPSTAVSSSQRSQSAEGWGLYRPFGFIISAQAIDNHFSARSIATSIRKVLRASAYAALRVKEIAIDGVRA